ncbi:MAG: ATP-binding cassette domain-containing protein [Asticcacaulis sp.]
MAWRRAGRSGLSGDNGVGKTTLLRTLAGLAAPHAGTITFVANDAQLDSETVQSSMIHLLGHHDACRRPAPWRRS